MGSSRIDVPDVKAWTLFVAAATEADLALPRFASLNMQSIDQVAGRLFYKYVYPFCRNHLRKFDNMGWEPWKAKPRSRYPDNKEVREALNEILALRVQRRTHEGVFYTYVPSYQFGLTRAPEVTVAEYLDLYKEPLYLPYEGQRYHVTAAFDGVSVYLEPYTDDPTAYALAELVAYHPHLANYLWETDPSSFKP